MTTERAVEKHVTAIFAKLDLPATADDHRRVLAVLVYSKASGRLRTLPIVARTYARLSRRRDSAGAARGGRLGEQIEVAPDPP